jgi:hypothetical protein
LGFRRQVLLGAGLLPTEGAATIMWDDFERKPAYYALLFRLAEARYGATS